MSGRTARELRMLIESGRLPATRPSGRWLVEPRHLDGVRVADPVAPQPVPPDFDGPDEVSVSRVQPPVQGGRPIGADPIAPVVDIGTTRIGPSPAPAKAAIDKDLGPAAGLVERLEQAAVQIADLRVERDSLRLRLREQVSSLQRSLEDAIEELDAARARVAELEARSYEESVRDAGTGARAALTPLFRATTPPPKRKS